MAKAQGTYAITVHVNVDTHTRTHTQLYTHTHRHARACTRRTCGVDVDALAALEEHVHLAMHVAVLVLFCSTVGGMGIWAIGSVSTIQYPLAHFENSRQRVTITQLGCT